jgi:uncharacterized membrane protein
MNQRPQEGIAMQGTSIVGSNSDSAPAPRSVATERGWGWWTDAWALFMRSAVLWVALGLIVLVGLFVVGMVPVLGSVAIALLMPALAGGWMLAARKVDQGGALEVADLFTGFQGERLGPLMVLGALLLAAMVVIGLVAGLLGAGAAFGIAMGGARHSMGGMMAGVGAGFAAIAVALVLGALITTALWFAPALVVFRKTPPVQALQLSVEATLKNVLPFLVFGLIYIAASIVASIPLGLGWIVLMPLSLLTAYVSYRDVFES